MIKHIYKILPQKTQLFLEKGFWNFSLKARWHYMQAKPQRVLFPDGIEIEYLDLNSRSTNSQAPVLLFLHGFSDQKESFYLLAKKFSKHFRVIIPDLPGFGASSCHNETVYTLENYALWIKNLLDHLLIKKVHIMGNSLGGGVSLQFGIDYPDYLGSAVLIDSAGVYAPDTHSLYDEFLNGNNIFVISDLMGFDTFLKRVFIKEPFIPFLVRKHLARNFLSNANWHTKVTEDLSKGAHPSMTNEEKYEHALNSKLKNITSPTLVVWGENDSIFPVKMAHILKDELPQSQVEILKNVGHSPQIEVPNLFLEKVMAFYRKLKIV